MVAAGGSGVSVQQLLGPAALALSQQRTSGALLLLLLMLPSPPPGLMLLLPQARLLLPVPTHVV